MNVRPEQSRLVTPEEFNTVAEVANPMLCRCCIAVRRHYIHETHAAMAAPVMAPRVPMMIHFRRAAVLLEAT